MKRSSLITISATLALCAHAVAQIPAPNPLPRVAPRAEWIVTTGVAGTTPANRHWSQGAGNGTSLFVFGGRTGTSGTGSKRNDLYEFDATTLTWTEHTMDGDPNAPTQRYRNTLAWDPTGNRLVVFGGEDSAGAILGDTWTWDATNGWMNITAAGGPPARRFASMAHHSGMGGLLMFGGIDSAGTVLNDTWLLIGGSSTWAPVATGGPGARAHHTLVTRDAPYNDVFLCAGHDNGASPNRIHYLDTWRWDSAGGWVQINPTTNAVPASMAGNQAVYDPIRRRVVLQGGQGISTNSGATGGAYTTQYGGSPSGWCSEFDCVTNEWLLYGGASFSTADPVIGRASRYYPAFIPATGKVYMFGGQNPSGTGAPLTDVKEYQANPIAATVPYGAGCSGAAGTVTLTADNRPWLGTTFNTTVGNLTPGSLVFGVAGFVQASTPVVNLHPAGGAGCDVLVNAAATALLVNSAGTASFPLPLPNQAIYAGAVLHMQAVQIELGPVSITTSNGVSMTAGLN